MFHRRSRGLCLVLVSPIDFWPCRFLSSRFPKLLAVSWLDIPFSMYSDTHPLPCIRPCLPTSHRRGETCEGFSSFRPTQLVAVRGYTVYVNPFWRHVCIRCSVSAWTLGCIWGRGLIAECLDSMAEKVCSSAFSSSWRFCFASKEENSSSPPRDHLFAFHGIPEDRKVDWVDEWIFRNLFYCSQRVLKVF